MRYFYSITNLHMKYFFLIIISLVLLPSCEVINPDEDVPSSIKISSVDFKAKIGEGSSIAEITDSWVYVSGELIGAFEMPTTIPVLTSGTQTIEIRPGVLLNGIAGTRTINPFFTTYKIDHNFEVGKTALISPKSGYVEGVIFPWNNRGEEDFEEGGISIDSVPGSSTKIVKSTDDVFEGQYSGKIFLDTQHKDYRGQSKKVFDLPKSGAYVVLEINVKNTDVPLNIGMYVNLSTGQVKDVPHITINPSQEWKKLYINFTELVSYYTTAVGYRVYFKADLGDNDSTALYMDNIKIMHF